MLGNPNMKQSTMEQMIQKMKNSYKLVDKKEEQEVKWGWPGMWQTPMGNEELLGADAISLYPSMDVEVTAKFCKKAFLETEVELKDVDYKEATRFLAMKMTKWEVSNHSLRKYIPKRKHKNGTRPTMASAMAKGPGHMSDESEQWEWPDVVLSKTTRKEINAEVFKHFVTFFFKSHMYTTS